MVGATDRPGSYAGETLLNLRALGYAGEVWGVNPGREEAHGFPCFGSLSDCPAAPDAVVVAIPAAGVPAVVDEAGAIGCGGAVVYGAGFGEVPEGRRLEQELAAAARRHGLPLCGPNGNGIVALHERAALWGDGLPELEAGRVALVSQSGNVAVNALATRRGLRLHTVVSCGNAVGLDPADWVAALAEEEQVGSIALYLEADGDGVRLCEALARCAERGVGVSVLKVGASRLGAAAAAAHTGALAGDQRVFRALVEEAGAAWATDVHELLELAKAQAVPGARPRSGGGLAILTCSGGDSALAADECERMGLALPALSPDTRRPPGRAASERRHGGQPARLHGPDLGRSGDAARHRGRGGRGPRGRPAARALRPARGDRARRGGVLGLGPRGHPRGAALSPVPVMVASTLPELLDDAAAAQFAAAGVPAVAGLRTGLMCAAALRQTPAEPARLRELAAAARRGPAVNGAVALAEHEAKDLLRGAGIPVVEGRLAAGEEDLCARCSTSWAPRSCSSSPPPRCCTRASWGRSRSTCAAPTTPAPRTGGCSRWR